MVPTIVKSGEQYSNRYGIFKHEDMIGKEFGSKVNWAVIVLQDYNEADQYIYFVFSFL